MRMPDGSLTSGPFLVIFVILFGLAFVSMSRIDYDTFEGLGWPFLFLILGWIWFFVGEFIVGDGGRAAQIEAERAEKRRANKNQEKNMAYAKEEDLDYAGALRIWERLGNRSETKRIRLKIREEEKVKVDQTVVQGDYVDDRDTIVKDSVINRSNVGAGGDDKFTKLKELKEMLGEGLIDDDEFKQMKKEILGK